MGSVLEIFPETLIEAAKMKTGCDLMGVHGVQHWERVTKFGLYIAAATAGVNIKVVTYFGMLHDSCRLDEGHDYLHGRRAAHWIRTFDLPLNDEEADQLHEAIDGHSSGKLHTDPTIGACWDADRLDLNRVGITPHPDYMSTETAKAVANVMQRDRDEWNQQKAAS